jgi:hypothetical protein
MDLKKVSESLTAAANELRGPETKPNELNAALGMALTEIVAALRIVKGQTVETPAAPTATPQAKK